MARERAKYHSAQAACGDRLRSQGYWGRGIEVGFVVLDPDKSVRATIVLV